MLRAGLPDTGCFVIRPFTKTASFSESQDLDYSCYATTSVHITTVISHMTVTALKIVTRNVMFDHTCYESFSIFPPQIKKANNIAQVITVPPISS